MRSLNRQKGISQGTSGQIIEILRRRALTIDELASEMGLSRTAIRAQLVALQHDGFVEPRGLQRSLSKPARTYGVTAEAELMLSRAYVPILTQLLHVLSDRLPRSQLDEIMKDVGRRLMIGRPAPHGTLEERVRAASGLLNELGGTTEVEAHAGRYVILGHGCPLAAATARYPEACNALESFLSEFVGQPVTKCCDRYERKRCCFEVGNISPSGATAR